MCNSARLITAMCNFIVIIYSIYVSMAIYNLIDSIMMDESFPCKRPHPYANQFRADSRDFRSTIYERMDIYADEDYQEEDYQEQDEDADNRLNIYSPFKVCYVNSYRVYDSNSTIFDYTKESEYDTKVFEELLGTVFNKMYFVFDDIHMVFSINHQQCIQYPDVIHNDEL